MSTELETIDFYPNTFHMIPEQDNPAFGDDECLMIVRDSPPGNDHAVVLHIVPDPIEAVTSVARFWRHDMAVKYCEMFEA